MRHLFAILQIFVLTFIVQAKPVDLASAEKVGQGFLAQQISSGQSKIGSLELDLVYAPAFKKFQSEGFVEEPSSLFYVFNAKEGGFVIVSADDAATPILGYSDEEIFSAENLPENVAKWLEGYKDELRFIIENNLQPSEELTQLWEAYKTNSAAGIYQKTAAAVSPLLKTKWDQSPYYNALCPYDNSYGQRTVTGCVATAMAQIMKFWNFPATGTGFHSYNHSKYGTLSANFGATSYEWGSMPNTVSSNNTAVATLMYHCGVSVDMNYGVASTGGSGAYVVSSYSPITHCSEYAFKNYFGYKSTLRGVLRSNYSQSQWLSLIKAELDGGRPVLYAGFGNGGGHCFVADGYDNNDYIHFNWGWGGSYDGYFFINSLNPSGVGTGGGSGGFNSGHQAVIGVEPPAGSGTVQRDLRLYSNIVVNPNPINYNNAFNVTFNVLNASTSSAGNFTGDIAAAVFNSDNQFISFIETKTGISLPFNSYFTNPLMFSTTGISEMTPGSYTIGVYYKPSGSTQWTAFGNGSYQNFASIQVNGNQANPMKLYTAITTSPQIIIRNQTFTVNFDVLNTSASAFNGDISVDLHKSDGTWIRELAIKTGLSLPSNYHYTNGLTYTINGGLPDEAGSYQLFVWNRSSGGDWTTLGSGTFSNPITIQVTEAGITADIYESNNTQSQAFQLPVNFASNSASVSSTGSNCHLGSDYDFYKIVLPGGYNYTLNPRIHDSYDSGNGLTYSLDALFSYSTDGTTWSDAYDHTLPGSIAISGSRTIYFKVSPYFTGETGTYLLDIPITRNVSTGIKGQVLEANISLYPNPVNNVLTVDLNDYKEGINVIKLISSTGQEVLKLDASTYNASVFTIPIPNLTTGIYFVQLVNNSGSLTKSIFIKQ